MDGHPPEGGPVPVCLGGGDTISELFRSDRPQQLLPESDLLLFNPCDYVAMSRPFSVETSVYLSVSL